jgi:hypothetical protein
VVPKGKQPASSEVRQGNFLEVSTSDVEKEKGNVLRNGLGPDGV